MAAEEALRRLASKRSGLLFGRIRKWWERRTLAKRLHTKLYLIVHDRPEPGGHPPPFYRDIAVDLERAVELNLFSTHELEYMTGRLAAYCRAKQEDNPTNSVEIDKTYLEWTRVMETRVGRRAGMPVSGQVLLPACPEHEFGTCVKRLPIRASDVRRRVSQTHLEIPPSTIRDNHTLSL